MPDPALRIGLSLPGGIAPGTFEAGAVAGLLAWAQEVNARLAEQSGRVEIDVIAGASAGALTGLLAARVLLAGDDPVQVFRRAWVIEPTLRALRGSHRRAPLSLNAARQVARRLLFAPVKPVAPSARQEGSLTLDIALGSLRGFLEQTPAGNGTTMVASYLDWSRYDFDSAPAGSDAKAERWKAAIESAVASASHPLAFPAAELERGRDEYTERTIVNFPDAEGKTMRLWYTDGGVLDNEPLGRCVTRVATRDQRAKLPSRLVLLVRSSLRWPPPAEDPAWSGPGRPRWTQTLARVLDLVATQAAGRDLALVEQVNARLAQTEDVANKIAAAIGENQQAHDALRESLRTPRQGSDIPAAEGSEIPAAEGSEIPAAEGSDVPLPKVIADALKSASGLDGKVPVEVEVVGADSALPGPRPFHSLVGFIERRQREDHFAAGYWSMLRWVERAESIRSRVGDTAGALGAARARAPGPEPPAARRSPAQRLPFGARTELLRLGFRAANIARADLDELTDRRESGGKQIRISPRRAGRRPSPKQHV